STPRAHRAAQREPGVNYKLPRVRSTPGPLTFPNAQRSGPLHIEPCTFPPPSHPWLLVFYTRRKPALSARRLDTTDPDRTGCGCCRDSPLGAPQGSEHHVETSLLCLHRGILRLEMHGR